MSVIAFIAMFITVIVLTWSSLGQNMITTNLTTRSFLSHCEAFNDAFSKVEDLFFEKTTKEKTNLQMPPSDRTNKVYQSPRTPKKESSKLFLCKNSDKEIKAAFERLFDHLYQTAPFHHKYLAQEISEILFPLLSEEIELHTLDFGSEPLNEIWYQILKGEKIPSLTQYVTFKAQEGAALYARYASIPVLEALLGPSPTQEILQAEEERYYNYPEKQSLLTQEELSNILSHHQISSLKKYFDFSATPKVARVIEGTSQDVSISLKIHS